MVFRQKLLLELVSVPFQLRVSGIFAVIAGNELTGNQTQLKRIACRRGRRRRRRFAFFTLSYNRFSKSQIEEFVKINPFHKTARINLRVINQIRRVERVGLLTGDECQARFRIPTQKRTGNIDVVVIESTRVSAFLVSAARLSLVASWTPPKKFSASLKSALSRSRKRHRSRWICGSWAPSFLFARSI